MSVPNFIAAPKSQFTEENIRWFGTGDTPAIALFNQLSEINDYADSAGYSIGDEIEIQVWTTVSPADSGWSKDDINPEWEWCAEYFVSSHTVTLEGNIK